MILRSFAVAAFLAGLGALLPAWATQEPKPGPKPPKEIDKATVEAWAKRGFKTTWMGVSRQATLRPLADSWKLATAADPNQALVDFLSGDLLAQGVPAASLPTTPEAKSAVFTADEAKQLALGDLHLKQNNPREAAAAYQKALARVGDGVVMIALPGDRIYHSESKEILDAKQAVADARKKLAQALLAAGNLDGAKKALDAATGVQVRVAADGKPAPLPVPAKLVLTVKKADLDRAGKLSAAEFKKLVTVETTGLPPADRKK